MQLYDPAWILPVYRTFGTPLRTPWSPVMHLSTDRKPGFCLETAISEFLLYPHSNGKYVEKQHPVAYITNCY